MAERAQLGLLGLMFEDQSFEHGLRGLALVVKHRGQRTLAFESGLPDSAG